MNWTLIKFLCQARVPLSFTVLTPNRPLRLLSAKNRQLVCRQGCVWITAPGVIDDVFLSAGQRWSIPNNGLVLVESNADAVIALDC